MPTEISGSTGVNKIQDNTIVNADINSSAAIAGSKISGGTGKVLQVVSMDTSTSTSSTSSTFADTAITLSITPSATSKVLVTVNANGFHKRTTNTSCRLRLRRGSTTLAAIAEYSNYTDDSAYVNAPGVGFTYLDTHGADGSTAVTYMVQLANGDNSGTAAIGINSSVSSITLMEIAG